MKLLNLLVCACFTLSLVGCAANRPYAMHKPADAPASTETATAESPPSDKSKREHPVWDKCKDGARTAAIYATAPIWGPFILYAFWRGGSF